MSNENNSSPNINFNFNTTTTESNIPTIGISHLVAVTTKGKYNDPSDIINSVKQFEDLFEREIVPDGSTSNCIKALENGSRIRVSRVTNNSVLNTPLLMRQTQRVDPTSNLMAVLKEDDSISFGFRDGGNSWSYVNFRFYPKEEHQTRDVFSVRVSSDGRQVGTTNHNSIDAVTLLTNTQSELYQGRDQLGNIISIFNYSIIDNKVNVDVDYFEQSINNENNPFDLQFVSTNGWRFTGIDSMESFIQWIRADGNLDNFDSFRVESSGLVIGQKPMNDQFYVWGRYLQQLPSQDFYMTDNDMSHSGAADDTPMTLLTPLLAEFDFRYLSWPTETYKMGIRMRPDYTYDQRYSIRLDTGSYVAYDVAVRLMLIDSVTRRIVNNPNPVLSKILSRFDSGGGGKILRLEGWKELQNDKVSNPYFEFVLLSSSVSTVTDMDSFLARYDGRAGGYSNQPEFKVNEDIHSYSRPFVFCLNAVPIPLDPTKEDWKVAADSFRNYDDAYQLACSHIHQNLSFDDCLDVHNFIAQNVNKAKDCVYYIEIPKNKTIPSGDPAIPDEVIPMDNIDMENFTSSILEPIGFSQFIAFFGGGLKYYNNSGVLTDCDVIGTVLGLGDTSALNNGPWYHFSGQTRGVVDNAYGIVSPNYGALGYYTQLDSLAKNHVNLFVIKNIGLRGNRVLLYHNFTTSNQPNSERFLGVVRLLLYIKKTLKPILESYLEEPNTFSTWKDLYYEIEPIFEDLAKRNGITEDWQWQGDQFVNSLDDLQVNNRLDVRNGKYKVKLTIQDVVALQKMTIDLTLDSRSNNISIDLGV